MGRELVNVSEAARRADVPRRTVVTWIRSERLFPVGMTASGQRLYDLAQVRHLVETTPRRRRRHAARSFGS